VNYILRTSGLVVLMFIVMICGSSWAEELAPLRKKFKDVKTISIEQLAAEFSSFLIVDARSRVEYDIININGAINVSIANHDFITRLKIAAPDINSKIVFYCNGYTCSKSYRAARKAKRDGGHDNVYALDAGIFLWGTAFPNKTSLLGETPLHKSSLISKAEFKSHLLDYKQFKVRANLTDTLVIDIRDYQQRRSTDGTVLELPNMPSLPKSRDLKMNFDLARKNLENSRFKDKQLLIYDAAGKQIKWLHYILKINGYKKFYFLKGGVYGVTNLVHI
jgi:rhodanese-related sulfurtransferase